MSGPSTSDAAPPRPKRPDPVTVVMGLAVFVTGFSVFFYLFFWAVSHYPASNFTYNGESVDQATFLAKTKPFFEFFPAIPLLSGIVSFGFWKERSWAREAALICSAIALAGLVGLPIIYSGEADGLGISLFVSLAYLGVLAFFLYTPASVEAYFRSLNDPATSSGDRAV